MQDGRKEVDDLKCCLQDGRKEVDDFKCCLQDGRKEVDDFKCCLQDGRKKVDDFKCCLQDGRKDVVKILLDLGGRENWKKGEESGSGRKVKSVLRNWFYCVRIPLEFPSYCYYC